MDNLPTAFFINRMVAKFERMETVEIEEAGNDTTDGVPQEFLVPLCGCVENIADAVKRIGDAKTEAIQQGASVHAAIKQYCNELREIVDTRENELLVSSEALVGQNVAALSAQEESLTNASAVVHDLIEVAKKTPANANDEEVVADIIHRVEEESIKQASLQLTPVSVANIHACLEGKEKIAELLKQSTGVFILPSSICGPGLEDAVVNELTHVDVYTADESPAEVKATLKSHYDETLTEFNGEQQDVGEYKIVYTPKIRGRHELEIAVNGLTVCNKALVVKMPPSLLNHPVGSIPNLRKPWGVAITSAGVIVVTEWGTGGMKFFNKYGQKIESIENSAAIGVQSPYGVAMDSHDNIYVANGEQHYISKLSKRGNLLKVTGRKGSRPGELNSPRGLSIINDQLYVCDTGNHRIQVFSTDLEYLGHFGRKGNGNGEYDQPQIVVGDDSGLLFISEWSKRNNRVQVVTRQGQFVRSISGQLGPHYLGKLCGLCIVGRYLYVVDNTKDVVVVVDKDSGEFVSLFGKGYLRGPCSVAVDTNGFVYVCTYDGNNVAIF